MKIILKIFFYLMIIRMNFKRDKMKGERGENGERGRDRRERLRQQIEAIATKDRIYQHGLTLVRG